MQEVSIARHVADDFPVGYYRIHSNVGFNFQMNRWLNWMGADSASALAEMRAAAQLIGNCADFVREFSILARNAVGDARSRKRGLYTRAAEFFMAPGSPEKASARTLFVRLMREYHGVLTSDYHVVPYRDGMLPCYVFAPKHDAASGTIVIHGGFDSYIEEWFPAVLWLRDAGYRVVAFDGPGQGGAREQYGLPLTAQWEKPVGAVLDYFGFDDVTLLGFSLGGGLAILAATLEPRVRRVIADDVLTDFLAVTLGQLHPATHVLVRGLLAARAAPVLNAVASRAMQTSLIADWGVRQGMHVMGVRTPAAFFRALRPYSTLSRSYLVTQDVLLMAGAEDHYVPRAQLTRQIEALTCARSITARMFTREEAAQNHCQIGNLGLSLRVIRDWIEQRRREPPVP